MLIKNKIHIGVCLFGLMGAINCYADSQFIFDNTNNVKNSEVAVIDEPIVVNKQFTNIDAVVDKLNSLGLDS
jgi:hypothetical protein